MKTYKRRYLSGKTENMPRVKKVRYRHYDNWSNVDISFIGGRSISHGRYHAHSRCTKSIMMKINLIKKVISIFNDKTELVKVGKNRWKMMCNRE
jgi:galactose-1-phosphate uridylyltransferase